MGQAQVVTDLNYMTDRETVLAYSEDDFNRDISDYILKLSENEDLREALAEATKWNRTMVEGRSTTISNLGWKSLICAGRAMDSHIRDIGTIIFQNWLDQTADHEQA